jgi:hypothetical protein
MGYAVSPNVPTRRNVSETAQLHLELKARAAESGELLGLRVNEAPVTSALYIEWSYSYFRFLKVFEAIEPTLLKPPFAFRANPMLCDQVLD